MIGTHSSRDLGIPSPRMLTSWTFENPFLKAAMLLLGIALSAGEGRAKTNNGVGQERDSVLGYDNNGPPTVATDPNADAGSAV